jgi:hypothetical protein
MRVKILTVTAAILLVAGFVLHTFSNNVTAQVIGESRILQAVLGLTEVLKGQTEGLVDVAENISDDLQFKKKFWRFEPFEVPPTSEGNPVVGAGVVALCATPPLDQDQSACAFNVESIQIQGDGNMTAIFADGVITDISGKQIAIPTNLLVDMGIGKIGASVFATVVCEIDDPCLGPFEFNGEKPQGMLLFPAKVVSAVEASSSKNNLFHLVCLGEEGQDVECPAGVP